MQVKRLQVSNFDQRGFSLIELVLVIGILAILATIALGEFYYSRQKAYDQQAITITRNLLNLAATSFATSEFPTVDGTITVGTNPQDYPELKVNPGIYCKIIYDGGNDLYEFYIASLGGSTAFFFWLPGDSSVANVVNGAPSDYIADDPLWRGGELGL
jgi:prepilin-type N-terminal cleavage/methylation domain-containing protein